MPSKKKKKPILDIDDILASMNVDSARVAAEEAVRTSGGVARNTNSILGSNDYVTYGLENRIAANGWFPLLLLTIITSAVLSAVGVLWYTLSNDAPDEIFGQNSIGDSVFSALQLIIAAGVEDIPTHNGLRFVFVFEILFGLVVFAVLVGFITDAIAQFMANLAAGRSKVAAHGHTLILGWNEATLRVVVQISFLRRQYQMLNESKWLGLLYFFPWLTPLCGMLGMLERPSTSLAVSDIVIMDDGITKDDMHVRLAQVLAERGINPKRTKLGRNIICRVGNPTNVNDLIRVGAHRASAILVMMTERDTKEEDESDGRIHNGATLRTTLALRHVLFTNPYSKRLTVIPGLRIVLQLQGPSEYVDATCFKHPNGDDVIIPMDLSAFLNSLMFKCAAQPGLSAMLMKILDFEGSAIRRRRAKNLRSGPRNAYGDCIGKTFGTVRKQFAKAVFIGIVRPGMPERLIKRRGFGLCPDPEIVIEPEDLLIFIGPKSSPVHSHSMLSTFEGYVKQATGILESHAEIKERHEALGVSTSKRLGNVLVCGWRDVWNNFPERLHARIEEVVRQRLPGSAITFVNAVPSDRFKEMMVKNDMVADKNVDESGNQVAIYGFKPGSPNHGVTLRHIEGDAAQTSVLSPVMMTNTIHTAVVLGTQTSVRLGAHHRDTRVLNILLLLRKLWSNKREGVPMHIVGENSEDMTAKLALAPKRVGKVRTEPDFVNSQAVSARTLVQTLAYPLIQPAIKELFEVSADHSADIVTVGASEYVPMDTPLKYGVVRALVLQAAGERSICIGVLWQDGTSRLLVPHDDEVTFTGQDRLVILRRITKGSEIKNRTEAAILLTREWRKKIRIRKLEAKVTKANAA